MDAEQLSSSGSEDCLSQQNLRSFALGKYPEPVLIEIFEHLISCPSCSASLAAIVDEGDTFVGHLSGTRSFDAILAEAEFERFQAFAKSLLLRPTADTACGEPPTLPINIERFEIRELLGEGSFGRVYLAHDPRVGQLVALKVPHLDRFATQTERERVLDEARNAAKLRKHPGIVTVYEVSRPDDEIAFIAMEYVAGGSFEDLLEREGKLTVENAVDLIAKVANTLDFAHKKNLVHRDLKPANILLESDGSPKIADFGLALHEDSQELHEGEVAGTLPYMSPEQVAGNAHFLDGRTDIWSLGVVMYEITTGRRPFLANKRLKLVEEILRRDPRPPRSVEDEITPELETICLRCLAKSPNDRYSTARDVEAAIHQLDFYRQAPARPNLGRLTAQRLLVSASCIFALAIVALLVLRARSDGQPVSYMWQDLPNDKCEVLVVPENEMSPWAERNNDLYVHSLTSKITPTVVAVGKTESHPYEVQVAVRGFGPESRNAHMHVGWFFGLRAVESSTNENRWKLQAVRLTWRQSLQAFVVERVLLDVSESNGVRFIRGTTTLAEEKVDVQFGRRHALAIVVRGSGLESVQWDKVPLFRLCRENIDNLTSLDDYYGRQGPYVRFTSTVFEKPRYRYLKEN